MPIPLPKSITENLRFLCVEVDSQLANLQVLFAKPTVAMARRIMDRSGYAYNLKTRIHSSCVNKLSTSKKRDTDRLVLRGLEFIATDLERITELIRDCLRQFDYVDDVDALQVVEYRRMLAGIRKGIKILEPALLENDSKKALTIATLETGLDKQFNRLLAHYTQALKKSPQVKDLTRGLFIARSIRQMGDVLRHISEAIISANLGQPVNFERYHSLQSLVEDLEAESGLLQIEPIAETRSGSAISGITATKNKKHDDYVAIFKDGVKQKVKEERQGVKSWHDIYPGLAPKILSYKKSGQSAALLIEHLSGLTFEKILLNEPPEHLAIALKQLAKTLSSVWRQTHNEKSVNAQFMQQLSKRLDEVYKIHPNFRASAENICDLSLDSFSKQLQRAEKLEKKLPAPFSVYIHGDFNVDNIIYDAVDKRINFIDLHRSRYMDYVQDVSVFMVSHYRLQILDKELRQRILQVPLDFYKSARRFARKMQDDTFELRLALGLARSFISSTRFILDRSLATNMHLRGQYLLRLVLAADIDKPNRFKIPLEEMFVD